MEPRQSPEAQAEVTLAEHLFSSVNVDTHLITCGCGQKFQDVHFFTMHQIDRLKDAGLMIGFSTTSPMVVTNDEVTFTQEVKPGEHWELTMQKDEPESDTFRPWGEQAQEGVLNLLRAMAGPPIDPDCVQGKHRACGGTAWDTEKDEPTLCSCACHKEKEKS